MRYVQNLVSHTKPPSLKPQKPPWRIALIANLKEEVDYGAGAPPDAGAEFDRRETVEAIAAALERDGHYVHILSGDRNLARTLPNIRPHICFNIAEGISGDAREAQVPALCELLGIPYTASRVLTHALSLDKTQTKRIWSTLGLPTAPYQEFTRLDQPLTLVADFPLIVKPAREGTGMGIDAAAIVHDEDQLRQRVGYVLRTYQQPALVEAFLPGREFTVGMIGNPGATQTRRHADLYDQGGFHVFPVLEIDSQQSTTPSLYGHAAKAYDIGTSGAPGYLCPAPIGEALRQQLVDIALQAALALGSLDVWRVDFRMDAHDNPYLLEINTLPGLNPGLSDLCIMAAAEGMHYDTLITEILYLAAARNGMHFEPATLAASELIAPTPTRRPWLEALRTPKQAQSRSTTAA